MTASGLLFACTFYTNLTDANLTNADLPGSFLESPNLSGANLKGTEFIGAVLVDANLMGAKVECADFGGAAGVDIFGAMEVPSEVPAFREGGAHLIRPGVALTPLHVISMRFSA